jgi:hypothetical protein
MLISLNFISGISLGIEFLTKKELGEEEEGWYGVIDLLIVRVLIEKM